MNVQYEGTRDFIANHKVAPQNQQRLYTWSLQVVTTKKRPMMLAWMTWMTLVMQWITRRVAVLLQLN